MTSKERRRLMNATPIRSSNKSQWQGAKMDPKENQDRAQGLTLHARGENGFKLLQSIHLLAPSGKAFLTLVALSF
jgi:hypothetical protein